MNTGVLRKCITAAIILIVLVSNKAYSQQKLFVKHGEEVMEGWSINLEYLQKNLGVSDNDFNVFTRFYKAKLDSDRITYYRKVRKGKITGSNFCEYLSADQSYLTDLYNRFQQIKKEYPSSVAEFEHEELKPFATCNAACNNIDFEDSTLNGWNGYYAVNNSTATAFRINGQVGGPMGAVTKAANDPNTAASTSSSDYQIILTSGLGTDPLVPAIPIVSPFGGKYSVRLGDSTNVGSGVAIISQSFKVTNSNKNFVYEYAVLLDNPPGSHTTYQQPFFQVNISDSLGNPVAGCSQYQVSSSSAKSNGFSSIGWTNPSTGSVDSVYYKNWTFVLVPLGRYIGQCITIQFEVADCSLGGHFGYAYVDASCAGLGSGIISSSPAFCGQKTITLTGPPGGSGYLWSGPAKGIVGTDSTQSVKIDSAGVYRLIITPFSGAGCNDTLYDTIKRAPGPPPVPFFQADTVCAGKATSFTNLSNPGAGAGTSFSWDFYNLGKINDTTTNPTWIYNAPGTYSVTLHELNNGCGADTTIKVKVDSNAIPSFRVNNPTCAFGPITFVNTSTGASSYVWNFGDGSSSTSVSPTHTFPGGGPYVVTLHATSGLGCTDSVKDTVKLTIPPKIVVTGKDSICPGIKDTLTATGGRGYIWTPGPLPTGTSVVVSPTVTTTYTVTGFGNCGGDTTFVVNVMPIPKDTITITPKDTMCIGEIDTLIAHGNGNFVWSTGQTSDSIIVNPTVNTQYILTSKLGKCVNRDTAEVIVFSVNSPVITPIPSDTVCIGDSITLQVSGGTTFKWSTGSTSTSIVVKPTKDSVFTVTAFSHCYTPQVRSITVHALPTPIATISGLHDTICNGDADTLKALGGISGVTTYAWSNGATTSTIAVTTGGFYRVTESNGKCSDRSAGFRVTVMPNVQPLVRPFRDSICPGTSDTLRATGGPNYTWSTGGSTIATTGRIIVNPSTTTTYSVNVHTYCRDTTMTVVLHVLPVPVAGVTSSLGDSICSGTTDVLTATGGTAGVTTYLWSPGGATTTTIQVTPTGNTTYTLVETNKACSAAPVTKTITIKTLPLITITATSFSTCSNEPITLTANGGSSYIWSNGMTGSSISFQPSSNEVISVSAINSSGCPDSAHQAITVTNVKPVTACCNDTIPFGSSAHVTASGVTSYVWSPDATVGCFSCPSTVVTPTANTVYTVTGTDSNGCKSTATITIIIECQDFKVPNVFTPNNDGINDLLIIHAEHEPAYSIEIYDRWGTKVFTSNNPADYWNGKINNSGAEAADGVYYYIIKSSCASDDYNKHGYIQLIRN